MSVPPGRDAQPAKRADPDFEAYMRELETRVRPMIIAAVTGRERRTAAPYKIVIQLASNSSTAIAANENELRAWHDAIGAFLALIDAGTVIDGGR